MPFSKIYTPLGADPKRPTDAPDQTLGACAYGDDGSEFIYVRADASGITGEGYVVLVDEAYTADMIDTGNSGSAFGQQVAVATAAFAANQYGWVQVKGTANIRVSASAAANTALNTLSTAGQLDDNAGAGAEVVERLVLTTARGAGAGNAEGVLTYPTVGATL